jgi:hypothetical protein
MGFSLENANEHNLTWSGSRQLTHYETVDQSFPNVQTIPLSDIGSVSGTVIETQEIAVDYHFPMPR